MIRFDSISAMKRGKQLTTFRQGYRIYKERDDFSFVRTIRNDSFPLFHFKVSLNTLDDGFKFPPTISRSHRFRLHFATHTHTRIYILKIHSKKFTLIQYVQLDPLKDIFQLIIMDLQNEGNSENCTHSFLEILVK